VSTTSSKTTSDPPGVIKNDDGTKYLERERADAFLGLIRAPDQIVRALDKSLRDRVGLRLSEYEVLLFLAVFSEDHSMSMAELRRRTPLSQSRVSRVVAALESEGLVVRGTDQLDSRAVTVTISARGLELFLSAQDQHLGDLHEHLFGRVTEEQIVQLAAITAQLLGGYPTGRPLPQSGADL